MSAETDLRDECVRLLRELLPELSGHRLSPRGENICFAASNRLARLDAFEPKDTERPAPEPASFVYRDADWPPPANGAPVHGLAEWLKAWERDEARPFFGVDRDAVTLESLRPAAEPEAPPPDSAALQELRRRLAFGFFAPISETTFDAIVAAAREGWVPR